MHSKGFISAWHEEFRDDPDYILESVLYDLGEEISRAMERENLGAGQLAERLGVSAAFVTEVLQGNPSLTVEQLVKIALALKTQPKLTLVARPRVLSKSSTQRSRSSSANFLASAGSLTRVPGVHMEAADWEHS